MSDDDTPPRQHSKHDAVQAETLRLLRHMSSRMDDLAASLGSIKSRLDVGDTHLDRVRNLPEQVIRLQERVDTMRLIVFGAVGLALLGLGGAIVNLAMKGTP